MLQCSHLSPDMGYLHSPRRDFIADCLQLLFVAIISVLLFTEWCILSESLFSEAGALYSARLCYT